MDTKKFQQIIWAHYKNNKRDFPWRKTRDPYKILVSEIMLQQTQALRVVPKYISFLKKFPTVKALAKAKLKDVLGEWQGLGYNRRALYLKRCAEKIEKDFRGKFPKDLKILQTLPGIGPATAGDIMAFAWNQPAIIIETNIRSVFIRFFFKDKKRKKKISDKEITPLIEKTLDKQNPREWYFALFDYGAYLKKTSNPSRKSIHHAKQSKFTGSYRQKRAHILRIILEKSHKAKTEKQIKDITQYEPELLFKILSDLQKEGFIKKTKSSSYRVA
ncbi:MAG TPA: A/G-specific adenine glycosylase [Candidatus Paceibacterota bacterium]|jgi:A/G-specific adenine glycosylase|nr:A/G-specific adenine glycosylase [Candidatus Paceibacterota bacterium]